MASAVGAAPGGVVGNSAGRGRLPLGITTISGRTLPDARRLSTMNPARPIVLQPVVVVAAAVQQVQHGIAVRAAVVSRRRVDVHPPLSAQRGRRIPDLADVAVRDGRGVFKRRLGARHEEHAVDAGDALLDQRVLQIDRPHAVDRERVAVEICGQRLGRAFPDALGILDEAERRCRLHPVAAHGHESSPSASRCGRRPADRSALRAKDAPARRRRLRERPSIRRRHGSPVQQPRRATAWFSES